MKKYIFYFTFPLFIFTVGSSFAGDFIISEKTPVPPGAVLKEKWGQRPLVGLPGFSVKAYAMIYDFPGKTSAEAIDFYRKLFGGDTLDLNKTKYFNDGYLEHSGKAVGYKTSIYAGGTTYKGNNLQAYGGDFGERMKECMRKIFPETEDPFMEYVFTAGEMTPKGWKEQGVAVFDTSYASVHAGKCEASSSIMIFEMLLREK